MSIPIKLQLLSLEGEVLREWVGEAENLPEVGFQFLLILDPKRLTSGWLTTHVTSINGNTFTTRNSTYRWEDISRM